MRIDTHLEVPGNATQAHVVAAKVGRSAVEDVRRVELVPAAQQKRFGGTYCWHHPYFLFQLRTGGMAPE